MEKINCVGLVELPDLRPPASAAGFETLSGSGLRETAAQIRSAMTAGTPMVVLAMQRPVTGLRPFLTRVSRELSSDHPLVLLTPAGAEPMDIPGAVSIPLPALLSDVLRVAGADTPQAATVLIDQDGKPQLAPSNPTEDDDWFTDDEQATPLAAATADAETGEDPWGDPVDPSDPSANATPAPTPAPDPASSDAAHNDPWGDPVDTSEPERTGAHAWTQHDEASAVAYTAPPGPAPSWVSGPGAEDSNRWMDDVAPTPDDSDPRGQTVEAPTTPIAPPNLNLESTNGGDTEQPQWPTSARQRPAAAPEGFPPADRSLQLSKAPSGAHSPAHLTDQNGVDPLDLFGSPAARSTMTRPAYSQHQQSDLCPIIVVVSGKGGTGKTTTAINLAQRAAEMSPGTRVVLIDANRGQGDIRKYLRIPPTTAVRSVFDAAASGDPRSAILTPDEVNSVRNPRLDQVKFSLTLAPLEDQCDPKLATAAVYAAVADLARRHSDLIVIDTQIVEVVDTTGLINDMVIPLLTNGEWGLCITDTSSAGVSNLLDMFKRFRKRSVPADRLTLLLNRAAVDVDDDKMRSTFSDYVSGFGHVSEDHGLTGAVNVGHFVHNHPEMAPMLDDLLFRVLGKAEFDPARRAPATKPRRRLFGRRR